MTASPFHCPHCGALYEKSDAKAAREDDRVVCVVCRNVMYQAQDARLPSFRLVKRPDGDTQ